jgi:hypothetical protein
MNLHHCRCIQESVRMLLHSLRAICITPGGAGSVWKCLEELASTTGVSERFVYGFRTELHFVDGAGWGQVRMSININQPLVEWSTCDHLLAESLGMSYSHVISHPHNVCGRWSEPERPQSSLMRTIIIGSAILECNPEGTILCIQWFSVGRRFVISAS